MKKDSVFLGKSDIAERWGIPQQSISYKSRNDKQFPKPYATIHNGRTPFFDLGDIKRYENIRGIEVVKYSESEKRNGETCIPGQTSINEDGQIVNDAGEVLAE